MKFKKILTACLLGLSIGVIGFSTSAQAKTWHYKVTKSNQFSYSHFDRAFMYGGENDAWVTLYTNITGASKRDTDYYAGHNLEDIDRNRTYYAHKIKSYPEVMALKFKSKVYYINQKDAKLYRYNTWRRGHKLISFTKPTNTNYVMLKAHTHVYKTQPWWYNFDEKFNPNYQYYKLSSKGNWYQYKF